MKPEELIEMMSDITERRKETLYHFIQNAKNCYHRDRGVEGWFQTELIAELKKKGKTIEHKFGGPDLKFPDGTEIELKMTTCFNPGWTIDGMINHKAPVLFFSGYLPFSDKKGNPNFEDEDAVKQWFQDLITKKKKEKMRKSLGQTGLNIMYKTVDLKEDKGIVGFVQPSKEISCVKI